MGQNLNTKLNSFTDVYHAPYRLRYRYCMDWFSPSCTCIVLYITSAVNVSGDPLTTFWSWPGLNSGIHITAKAYLGDTMYKNCFESACYFNILFFMLQPVCFMSQYTVTLAMFLIVLFYGITIVCLHYGILNVSKG